MREIPRERSSKLASEVKPGKSTVIAAIAKTHEELEAYADSEHSPDLCDQPNCIVCAGSVIEL